jgi:TetR/AcrR family transcriptional repressor of multidrug resistance operon
MRPKNLEKEGAIKAIALQIIAEEGLENLTMQKLAKAANISPRTIYIKYENKEDLLLKLYIEEVLVVYESAILKDFKANMDFSEGVKKLWTNAFTYLSKNPHAFALIRHGKTSPLLNKAYKAHHIKEGDYFKPIHNFFAANASSGKIKKMPGEAYRALLFSPLLDLVAEFFDYQERPKQIVTAKLLDQCCNAVVAGLLNT